MDKETIKNLLQTGAEAMSEEQIAAAIKMRFMHFGSITVSRRVSSGGRVRTFSDVCDVYLALSETEPQQKISPKSGWKIEKAAREVFSRLRSQTLPAERKF
jgi:hypothetical protein